MTGMRHKASGDATSVATAGKTRSAPLATSAGSGHIEAPGTDTPTTDAIDDQHPPITTSASGPGTQYPGPGRSRWRRIVSAGAPYILLTPAIFMMTLFVLLPVAIVIALSLFHYDLLAGSNDFVGLGNVRAILRQGQLLPAIWHTILYWLITAPVIVVVALLVAVAINSLGNRTALWRTVYFMPAASTLAAMSVIWTWMFYPNSGVIDSTLGRALGITDWLGSTTWALPAVALVGAWQGIGSSMVMFLAGLNNVNPDLIEAARLDHAKPWQRFWHVSFPALGPSLTFATVVATRNALSAFDQIQVMTAGGPVRASTTLSFLMWQQAIAFNNLGTGAVISVVLLLLVLAATYVQLRSFGRRWEMAGAR